MYCVQFYWGKIEIHHCVSLRYTAWFDLHLLWSDYHSWWANIILSYRYNNKKKRRKGKRKKNVLLMMRTHSICSLNFPYIAVLAVVILLYITSLVLTYLITGSLCLLTTFPQFPLPHPLSLVTSLISFSMTCFLDSTCKWKKKIEYLFFSFWFLFLFFF